MNLLLGYFWTYPKAFDTVDHSIALSKLEHYGIRGLALEWFKNYLTERYQIVRFQDIISSKEQITCSVPQGSILGPLLFHLYWNDIHRCSEILSFILFADDTNIFYGHGNIKTLNNIVNTELVKVSS